MDPRMFGRGTWVMIFHMIYMFILDINQIKIFRIEKKKLSDLPSLIQNIRSIYINPNLDSESKNDLNMFLIEAEDTILELFKKNINRLIDSLPCNDCKQHTKKYLKKNNLYDEDDIFLFLHFFIELRNYFYHNKIDRKLFKTESEIIENKKLLFKLL